MTCTQDGGQVIFGERDVDARRMYAKRVTYRVTMTATRELNGKNFICTTHLRPEDRPEGKGTTQATNVPDYSDTYRTSVLNVLCK